MKNTYYFLLFLGAMAFSSCSEEVTPFQDLQPEGSILTISDIVTGFYNLSEGGAASIGFTVDGIGENISSAILQKSINGGAPVDHATVSSFPTSFTVSLADAVSGLGVGVDGLNPGDQITFSFKDITTGSGTFASGAMVPVNVSCISNLDGEYALEATGWCGEKHTGTIEFRQVVDGQYELHTSNIDGSAVWLDSSMGSYYACYGTTSDGNLPGNGSGPLRVVDICNTLSWTGASQWGEIYTFNSITVNGPVLTIDWKNSYDPEAGVAVITRTDGTDWPPLKN